MAKHPIYLCLPNWSFLLQSTNLDLESDWCWRKEGESRFDARRPVRTKKGENDIPAYTAEELDEVVPDYIEIDFPDGPKRGILAIERFVREEPPQKEEREPKPGAGRYLELFPLPTGRVWRVGYVEGHFENGERIVTDPNNWLMSCEAGMLVIAYAQVLIRLLRDLASEGFTWRSLDPLTDEEIAKPPTKEGPEHTL
jgi:hypothetical protein